MLAPKPAYFWDDTTNSWRKAVVGEAGEYVWNNTTNAWEFGTIGAEYLYNHSTKAWDFGPGGQYVYNHSTKSWDKVTEPGYGGPYYWDTTTNSWVPNPGNPLEAASLIARMTTAPDGDRADLIGELIADLKTAGIWDKLDVLYILAAHDAQAARLNWKADAYNLTAVNSPTFTVDRGYAGDGVSMHLTTGLAWASASNYLQNDNLLFSWERTDVSAASYSIGNTGVNAAHRLLARTSTSFIARTSSFTNSTATIATSVGLSAAQRTAASAEEFFKNGSSIGTASAASTTKQAGDIALLRDNATYAARSLAAAGVGASLSSAQHAALYTALNTYLTAVGAA